MKKRMKKEERWNIEKERQALNDEQPKLRERISYLNGKLDSKREDWQHAVQENDGDEITRIDTDIQNLEKELDRAKATYDSNARYIEQYSNVLAKDAEAGCFKNRGLSSVLMWASGTILTTVGLAASFMSDETGSMIRKKSFDMTCRLPIIGKFIKD